jgi:hypothetical protein
MSSIPPLVHDNGARIEFIKITPQTVKIEVTRSNSTSFTYQKVGINLARAWYKKWIAQGFKSDV